MTPPPSDRDKRIPKTPPQSVRAQSAPPQGESWNPEDTGNHAISGVLADDVDAEGITPVLGVPLPGATVPVTEPVGVDSIARAQTRVKETRQMVAEVKKTSAIASEGVTTLRLEMVGHIERIDGQFVTLGGKVDNLGEHVLGIKDKLADMGEMKGAFGEVVKALDSQRQQQQRTFESHTEIDTVARITEIKDAGHRKRTRRESGLLILKWVGGVLAAAATVLITHFAEHC